MPEEIENGTGVENSTTESFDETAQNEAAVNESSDNTESHPEQSTTDDKQNKTENEYSGAPETYDFKEVNLPEGFRIDTELAEKFAPIGKKLNLSQQGANELAYLLIDFQQSQMAGANEKIAEYEKQKAAATKLSYEKMLNTDKEIGGGDTTKMNAYLDVADVGYNSFASSELKQVLSSLNLDYHPAVIKHFHRLGKMCGIDKISPTGKPVGKTDPADILYGKN